MGYLTVLCKKQNYMNVKYKYRRKVKTIYAVQFTGDNYHEVLSFMNETEAPMTYNEKNIKMSAPPHAMELDRELPYEAYTLTIPTLEGNQIAVKMDYVLRGYTEQHGYHFWINKPEYFESNNDKV